MVTNTSDKASNISPPRCTCVVCTLLGNIAIEKTLSIIPNDLGIYGK